MSKVLKTAALVVGAAALIVATAGAGAAPGLSAIGASVGGITTFAPAVAPIAGSIFGVSAASLAAISSGFSISAALRYRS